MMLQQRNADIGDDASDTVHATDTGTETDNYADAADALAPPNADTRADTNTPRDL